MKNRFVFYAQKEQAEKYVYSKVDKFDSAWIDDHAELAALVRDMFPISLISIHASPEEQCKMYLEEKVFGHRKTNRKKLTPEQRQEILDDLGKILGKKIKYPNPALNPLGCHIGEKDKLGYYWIKRLKQK